MQKFRNFTFHLRNIYMKMYSNAFFQKERYNHIPRTLNECQFPEQIVEIKTCGALYEKWRNEGKLRVAKNALTFRVPFVDTYAEQSCKLHKRISPVILALHGAPGSYKDFSLLTSYLHFKGLRVIAPSFPDFECYKPGIFKHSDEEKAEYIKDFLSAINVTKIDLLMCHSSAIYPGLLLCLGNSPSIKSLAMFNAGTFNAKKMRSTRHFRMLQGMVKASENPVTMKLLEYIGLFLLRAFKVPVKLENIYDPVLSATAMVYGNISEAKEKFLRLSASKFPMLYIFSENDVLVGKEPSYELAHLLGVKNTDIYVFDSKGILKHEGKDCPALKVISFEAGSHYVFWKHHEIVGKIVADFCMKEMK